MHAAALRGFTRNMTDVLEAQRWPMSARLRVLDMGGQDVNGTVHTYLRNILAERLETLDVLDIEAGTGVTIVGNARKTDWWDGQLYDLVISTEMLEHLRFWSDALYVAWLILRPGGWFVGTCASIGRAPHGATGAPEPELNEWYENVSPGAMADALAATGFDPIEIQYSYDTSEPHGAGDLYWRARRSA